MSLRKPDDITAPFTPAELAELASVSPGSVRIDDEGRIIPLVSRQEVWVWQQRYPSLDPRQRGEPPARVGDGRDDLRARYPTMFKKP